MKIKRKILAFRVSRDCFASRLSFIILIQLYFNYLLARCQNETFSSTLFRSVCLLFRVARTFRSLAARGLPQHRLHRKLISFDCKKKIVHISKLELT